MSGGKPLAMFLIWQDQRPDKMFPSDLLPHAFATSALRSVVHKHVCSLDSGTHDRRAVIGRKGGEGAIASHLRILQVTFLGMSRTAL